MSKCQTSSFKEIYNQLNDKCNKDLKDFIIYLKNCRSYKLYKICVCDINNRCDPIIYCNKNLPQNVSIFDILLVREIKRNVYLFIEIELKINMRSREERHISKTLKESLKKFSYKCCEENVALCKKIIILPNRIPIPRREIKNSEEIIIENLNKTCELIDNIILRRL